MESSNEDDILRNAVRQNLDKWLQKLDCSGDVEKKLEYKLKFVEKLRSSPVAVETERANEQHYEVPTDFFRTVSCIIILRGEIWENNLAWKCQISSNTWPVKRVL